VLHQVSIPFRARDISKVEVWRGRWPWWLAKWGLGSNTPAVTDRDWASKVRRSTPAGYVIAVAIESRKATDAEYYTEVLYYSPENGSDYFSYRKMSIREIIVVDGAGPSARCTLFFNLE
jgi:hypothetical protein